MGERINIAINAITNNIIGLDICYLLEDNLPLNPEDKKVNRDTNKSKNNILSKKEFTTKSTNLQSKTSDPAIYMNLNFDSTLLSSHITVTNPTMHRQESQKAKLNKNKKSNTCSYILAINDLDFSFYNSVNGSFLFK